MPTAYTALQTNPQLERAVLVEARAHTAATSRTIPTPPAGIGERPISDPGPLTVFGGETAFYFSDAGVITAPTDTPANRAYPPRHAGQGFRISTQAFDGAEPTGLAAQNAGAVEVANLDGEWDALANHDWAGRRVDLLIGRKGNTYSQFGSAFCGTISSVQASRSALTLVLRDRRKILDQAVQQSLYGGGGGSDGDSDLQGQPKPLLYGKCRNVTPVTLVQSLLIYQVHAGQINAVDDVRDRGVSLNFDSDYASYATLAAASVSSGDYATCLAEGLFRLGGAPDGQVTADIEGDASGGYVSTVADIVRRIITRTRLEDPADIDTSAFSTFETAVSGTAGIYLTTQETVEAAATRLLASVGAYLVFGRDGSAAAYQLAAPSSPVSTLDDSHIISMSRVTRGQRSNKRRVGWRPMWTVQGNDDLAGSVSDANRALYGNAYRYVTASNDTASAESRLSQLIETGTFFENEADATTLATLLAALHGPRRDVWEVITRADFCRYWLGDSLTLQTSRYGLDSGQDFRVIGIDEDYATAETRLLLWG